MLLNKHLPNLLWGKSFDLIYVSKSIEQSVCPIISIVFAIGVFRESLVIHYSDLNLFSRFLLNVRYVLSNILGTGV